MRGWFHELEMDMPLWDDDDILRRLRMGLIRVDLDTLRVQVFQPYTRRYCTRKPRQNKGRWNYKFGHSRTKQRTIYRNKLIWMAANDQVVPDGMVVDHIDGNGENDHPSNLRLMSSSVSHLQGHEKLLDNNFDSVMAFFDHILWYGVEPIDDFCGIQGAM